ncbi:MAG: sulfurtransferase [Nitrospirae bacterium]|jgi:thiosulfate/3-mercaptopyruvate sulfurtransferase|nr:sulfurtransferase [Nitrospirota bacterium]
MNKPFLLIDTETLAQNLGRKDLVILDVRGKAAYSSHIPGAIGTTWHEYSDPNAIAKGLLNPDVGYLEKKIQSLGINSSSDVVIYSNPFDNWGDEGRMFWLLQYLGHESIRILDGGWVKWVAEHRPFEHAPPQKPTGDFKVSLNHDVMMKKDALKKMVKGNSQSLAILDARSLEEYAGKEIDGIPRPGHIPGARNIPWNSFLNPDATVKDLGAIKNQLEEHGIREDLDVVTYCLGGVRSAWLYFILHLIGYEHVKNYPGSWWEWSRDFAAPAEKDVKLLHKINEQAAQPASKSS